MTIDTMIIQLAIAFLTTMAIFGLTLLGSLPLGLLVYFGKTCRFKVIRAIVSVYISIMRGTPLMLQMMVLFFVPGLLFDFEMPDNWRFLAVILAFIINYAAYFAEIYRGGIESIPKGQREAAAVLGYSRSQTFVRIILPQMIKRIMPALTNEVITLVKDTSLAYTIGTVEMFTRARQIAISPHSPGMLAFVVAAAFYYAFNYLMAFIMGRIEKKLSYFQ